MKENCAGRCLLFDYCEAIEFTESLGPIDTTERLEIDAARGNENLAAIDEGAAADTKAVRRRIFQRFEDDPEAMRTALEAVLTSETQYTESQQSASKTIEEVRAYRQKRLEERAARAQDVKAFLGHISQTGCPGPVAQSSGLLRQAKKVICHAPVPASLEQTISDHRETSSRRLAVARDKNR